MSVQLSLLPNEPSPRHDPAAVAELVAAVRAARRTVMGVRVARARRRSALCDWTGPARRRHDDEAGALDGVAHDLDTALAHLAAALGAELARVGTHRARRSATW